MCIYIIYICIYITTKTCSLYIYMRNVCVHILIFIALYKCLWVISLITSPWPSLGGVVESHEVSNDLRAWKIVHWSGEIIILHQPESCGQLLGSFPLPTMIIVRENSEVVVIYPDLCLLYLLKLVIMSQNIRNVQRLCQYIQYSPMKIKYHLKSP